MFQKKESELMVEEFGVFKGLITHGEIPSV